MKPFEARILHVDDSEIARKKVAEAANDIGACVVGSAASFEEAKEALERVGELEVNIILTDDSLSEDRPYEGRYVYDIAHEQYPDVHVLSVSGGTSMSVALGIPHVTDKGTNPITLKAAIENL